AVSVNFFLQAEDGIRDFHVTGVQTCALPIWVCVGAPAGAKAAVEQRTRVACRSARFAAAAAPAAGPDRRVRSCRNSDRTPPQTRSEERRVGKERKTRRVRNHWTNHNKLASKQ